MPLIIEKIGILQSITGKTCNILWIGEYLNNYDIQEDDFNEKFNTVQCVIDNYISSLYT